ncbi:MAG: preprotein translocase subunit SecG [Thermogutta sp.]
MKFVFLILLVLTAVFLILLILIQRGRGGGLAGAFGGLGGQSAFGAKAGDTFTRITIGVAAFWIGLCIFTTLYFRWTHRSRLDLGPTAPTVTNSAPLEPTSFPSPSGQQGSGGSGASDAGSKPTDSSPAN